MRGAEFIPWLEISNDNIKGVAEDSLAIGLIMGVDFALVLALQVTH